MQPVIQGSFCYNGQDFGLVEEDTIVQLSGNSVVCWNGSTGHKDYIPCPRDTGYSRFATNQLKSLIAVAEYGLRPKCHIFQMPGKKQLCSFEIDTTLKAEGMAFSREGKYLAILGGLPDFKISIFDLENKQMLQIPETKLPCKEEIISVSFNPKTKNEFCVLTSSFIHFYRILPAFQVTEPDMNEADDNSPELADSFRLECRDFSVANIKIPDDHNGSPVMMTSLKWDPFGRVYLCTNLNRIFMINPNVKAVKHDESQGMIKKELEIKVEQTLELDQVPMTIVITMRNLIVSTSDGMLSWYKIDMPIVEPSNHENAPDQSIKFDQEIEKEYNFSATLGDSPSPAQYAYYSKSYKRMIIGTCDGVMSILPIEAEKMDMEDEDEDHGDKEKQTLTTPLDILGRFHVDKVISIRELGKSTQFVTISADQTFAIWEATSGKQLANKQMGGDCTSLDVSKDGKVVFIGSDSGIFRAYDVSNRRSPRLVNSVKYYSDGEPISDIVCSPNGAIIVVSSSQSNRVWLVSQKASEHFTCYGYIVANGHVLSSSFTTFESSVHVMCLLNNGLVQMFKCPREPKKDKMKPFTEEAVGGYVRKVDPKTEMIISSGSQPNLWFVAGSDYYLKKYTIPPNEQFRNVVWATPAGKPEYSLESHALELTAYCFSDTFNLFVSGGKDGKIFVRSISDLISKQSHNLTQCTHQTHSVLSGGISAICLSKMGQYLYVAGQDGSIFIYTLSGDRYPKAPVEDGNDGAAEAQKMPTQQEQEADEIQYVIDIIQQEANRVNEEKKRQFKEEIMNELDIIARNLRKLLDQNDNVADIEKLEREEFVIDVERQQQFLEDGENVCTLIRQDAEKETLKLQLLREIVTKNTWETMEVQSKACKSMGANNSERLLFNFSIRKRRPEEERLYKQIIIQRKIELMQRAARIDRGVRDALDETIFSQALLTRTDKEKNIEIPMEAKEEYFMNRLRGKPQFVDDDAIKLVQAAIDAERAKRDAEREKKKNQGNQQANDGSSKEKPILIITKGRLGTKTKKVDENELARLAAMNQKQTVDIIGMEEFHWKVSFYEAFKRAQNEELAKVFENQNPYDMLYNVYELYTGKRKRAQIEILKAIVFELKRDYNKEFAQLEVQKEDYKLQIKEKNEQIRELLANLKDETTEVKEIETDDLEMPERILEINEKELESLGEKHLTKEERAIKEEADRKARELEEQLNSGDNVQTRGLKTMMGGNELTLKKDKGKTEVVLEMADWMHKPYEQMNEEEKTGYDEFLKRKKELEEKQQKAWRQTLNVLKSEVQGIKVKFEEELLALYKKRLFYEARIYEQELYIIRLVIMLSDVKQTEGNISKFKAEKLKLEQEYEEKAMLYGQVQDLLSVEEQKTKTDNPYSRQDQEIAQFCNMQQLRPQQIKEFIKKGKAQARVTLSEVQKAERTRHIVHLDPYAYLELGEIMKQINEEESEEKYHFELHKPGECNEEQFDRCVEMRKVRIEMNKEMAQKQQRLSNLRDYKNFLEEIKNKLGEKKEFTISEELKWLEHSKKLKFNYEVIIYIRQGQVEIPQQPVTTDYKDAVLVKQSLIDEENAKIRDWGRKKIEQMNSIKNHKQQLKTEELKLEKLKLQTEDFKERAKDVQLYRVTKQTQEIIQGKHTKRDEEDKKRLEQQIKQLEENTANRIKAIQKTQQKLRREIREKIDENRQLEDKARTLKQQVEDRQSIIKLRSNDQTDDKSDPCAEIAQQRKLMEVIKQQSEEMMFLKDELDRLRARTFPSFAHLQKPEYPDERV